MDDAVDRPRLLQAQLAGHGTRLQPSPKSVNSDTRKATR